MSLERLAISGNLGVIKGICIGGLSVHYGLNAQDMKTNDLSTEENFLLNENNPGLNVILPFLSVGLHPAQLTSKTAAVNLFVHHSTPEEYKEIVLYHEYTEAMNVHEYGMSRSEAHNKAVEMHRQYAAEHFSEIYDEFIVWESKILKRI